MDTCTVETGLLRKHPCGEKAATKCANCEQFLCAKHAKPKMSAGKRIYLCPECERAWKESDRASGPATPGPAGQKPGAAQASAPKPAAPKPAAPKPAAQPEAAKKPAPEIENSGPLEFTPSKKPEDKQ